MECRYHAKMEVSLMQSSPVRVENESKIEYASELISARFIGKLDCNWRPHVTAVAAVGLTVTDGLKRYTNSKYTRVSIHS